MLRSLIFMIKFCAVAALVIWVSQNPGSIAIEWMNYKLTLHVGLFFIGLLILVGIAIGLHQIYRGLLNAPKRWRKSRAISSYESGFKALSIGLTAVAAGDKPLALAQSRKARKYLPENPGLSLLLQAQVARMQGNDKAARKAFMKLMDDKEAGFLGVRGLLQKSLDDGDYEQARSLTDEALQKHAKHPWLLQVSYQLAIEGKDWAAALTRLKALEAHKILDSAQAGSDRLALLIAEADMMSEDQSAEALRTLKKAYKINPYFAPLVIRLAEIYKAKGKYQKAASITEKAWRKSPHPQLATLWPSLLAPAKAEKEAARTKWMARLLKAQPKALQSHLALANASMEEGMWNEARAHLETAEGLYEQDEDHDGGQRLYKLCAMLERLENSNEAAAQEWLVKAGQVNADRGWVCHQTGKNYTEWSPVSHPHGSFNSMEWSIPGTIVPNLSIQKNDTMAGLLQA